MSIKDLPADRMRMHVCWGSTLGPHHGDVPLKDIVDIILKAKPQAVSFPGANPRHGHEWKVWQDVKLPDGKAIIPGVIDSTSNFVEHPELVADRIVQYAKVVGRENVIAGVDCGFGTFAGRVQVDTKIVWMKLASLSRGGAAGVAPVVVIGAGAQSQRLDHHPEHLGVVHRAAHPLAAGAARGQDHVLAGVDAGVEIFRQVAEPQHRAGPVAVALVRLEGALHRAGRRSDRSGRRASAGTSRSSPASSPRRSRAAG